MHKTFHNRPNYLHRLKSVLEKTSLAFFASCLVLFDPSSYVFARWAELEDATATVKVMRWNYKIRRNGSSTLRVYKETEILKEAARAEYGMQRLNFDPVLERFRILRAEIINGGKKVQVHRSNIEIKPLASSGPGFNTRNQVTIVFPDTNVGSKLILEYEKEEIHSSVPGLFSEHFLLAGDHIENLEVEMSSEAPLHFKYHDPGDFLNVQVEPKKVRYSLKKPYFRRILDEPNPVYNPTDFIWIAASNINSIDQLPEKTVLSYAKEIESPLPPVFQSILTKAQTYTTDVEQINSVTSQLADSVRYVGDWRAVKSGFHPRSLATIARTAFGDCKDYTVSAGAILKRLGFEVTAAWIWRGQFATFSPLDTPALDVNHAILYVRKNNRSYWVDPTNRASDALGIFPDIADRPVIVLDPGKPYFTRTPAPSFNEGEIVIRADIDLSQDQVLVSKGSLELKGSAALPWTASGLASSKRTLDHSLIRWVANADNLTDWKIGSYDLSSRIRKDLEFEFTTQEIWRPVQSSVGLGILIPGPFYHSYFRFQRSQRVSGVRLDTPVRLRRELRITGRDFNFKKPITCKGESEWANFERDIRMESGTLRFQDQIIIKKTEISATAIPSLDFEKFQNSILHCLQESVMLMK